MKTSLTRTILQAYRDERGANAIEFSLLAPVFFLVMIGLFEVGLFTYTAVSLESIVARAGREASIGNMTAGGGTRVEQVQQMIRDSSEPLIGSENIQIDLRELDVAEAGGYSAPIQPDICLEPYGIGIPESQCSQFEDLNGNGVYDAQATSSSAGNAEDVVEINVRLPWRANFAIVKSMFGENGVAVIKASTIVKNEPFDN